MKRIKGMATIFLRLLLLTSSVGPEPGTVPETRRVEHSTARCFTVEAPEVGHYWLTLRTRQPSTAPALLVLGGAGRDPRPVERLEATLLEIEEPGEQLVCFTSQAAVGKAEMAFEKASAQPRSGDPLEVEVDEDP